MLTQSTTLMSPTTCRRAHARGRFLVGAALLTSVSNSIAGSDLPLSLGRRGASLWGGGRTIESAAFDSYVSDDLPTAAGLADVSQQFYCR